jgi:hypothetical protein
VFVGKKRKEKKNKKKLCFVYEYGREQGAREEGQASGAKF